MTLSHYLVTGGAGFIGSHLVEALLAKGHEVVVLDDLSTGKESNIPEGVALIRGSVANPADIAWGLRGAHGIFHLAAIASVQACEDDRETSRAVNEQGTRHIMEAAAEQKIPVVYASSAAVYGDNPNLPLKEWEAPQPMSAYGLDKLSGESAARLLATQQGLRSVGIRPFNVYGPRQDPSSPYSGVISIFTRRLRENRAITLFGDGGQTRDFIYVTDLVRHLSAGMEALESGQVRQVVLNGCTGKTVTIRELAEKLMQVSGNAVPLEFAPARQSDIRHSQGDNELACETLGVQAQTLLEEGLRHLWNSEK